MNFARTLAAIFALLPLSAAGQSVISNTILVPLYYRTIPSGESKLGIYASLGGGTPNIFEFDTGDANAPDRIRGIARAPLCREHGACRSPLSGRAWPSFWL